MNSRSLAYYLLSVKKVFRREGFGAILNPFKAYNQIVNLNSHRRTLSLLNRFDFSHMDLVRNNELMSRFNQMKNVKVETINWLVPNFRHAFGGIYTILRFADYFHSCKGIKNRFVVFGDLPTSEFDFREKIRRFLPGLSSEEIIVLDKDNISALPYSDISIATTWESAYLLLKFNETKGKFYFIQDYEPLFYPAGVAYALAEATYRFGFFGITNTPGVSDTISKELGGIVEYFVPAVDRQVFYPSERKFSVPSDENPFTIFFYARSETPRNAFELGISALHKIKRKYGRCINIYTAGSDWHPEDYGMKGEVTPLGTLPYEKTAALYRKCDLGIVFMFTKHPSYLPFELMACGCPVLTNFNSSTTWLLEDGKNCVLTQPSTSAVCEKIDWLIENPNFRANIAEQGLKSVAHTNWTEEIEKIHRFICRCRT